MSQFFASGGEVLKLQLVLLMNIQDRFPLESTGLTSLQSEVSQESSPTPQFKNINTNFILRPAVSQLLS